MAWTNDFYGGFAPYVPVAARRARALAAAARLAKGSKGKSSRQLAPVAPIKGGKIARSFWGRAWCENLESYSDYENRLPRGRSYVRHGCVADLQIAAGRVTALVSGSSLYEITIAIKPLPPHRWDAIAAASAGQIDSLVTLLQGSLPESLLEQVTNRDTGLFPAPREIDLDCSCPDWADMCKHVAAALYGVGARLDDQPDLLFTLRGVNQLDLVSNAMAAGADTVAAPAGTRLLGDSDLSAVFGVEIAAPTKRTAVASARTSKPRLPSSEPVDHGAPRRRRQPSKEPGTDSSKARSVAARPLKKEKQRQTTGASKQRSRTIAEIVREAVQHAFDEKPKRRRSS
ncbi:MAG: SWIM zinc finger family protein [Polyangia bacterium]